MKTTISTVLSKNYFFNNYTILKKEDLCHLLLKGDVVASSKCSTGGLVRLLENECIICAPEAFLIREIVISDFHAALVASLYKHVDEDKPEENWFKLPIIERLFTGLENLKSNKSETLANLFNQLHYCHMEQSIVSGEIDYENEYPMDG
ncbi:hypothetical protein DDZ13_09640 [Coraliomargarita sinensis]|uniref:Uncharacterized protein n=1 Tax=Coraliomargarita sinensis TaxID=2174842 RepID=A0A317ZG77_9BACT|nr:hypothetical protein [Coraliomargarita sinensis]PXA03892.1 hypothetical protein DDZ13_09640 [Coraliomargarita sinensis]